MDWKLGGQGNEDIILDWVCNVWMVANINLEEVKKDLEKRYRECKLKGEIFLWQICIMEHPDDKECYENAIKSNLDKLRDIN